MSTQIVTFSPSYTDAVAEVILTIQQTEFTFAITRQDQPDLDDIPNFYQRRSGNFWIALAGETEKKVIGTIGLKDIGNGQAALRKMFVHKDYRGSERGVARELLETLFTWARAHELKEIYLGTTSKFLAAHRFYEKSGFQEITEADLPADFPKMPVDNKFYKYVL